MLVLSRKDNEQLMIGDDIEMTVLKILGNRVKIGLRAPSNVKILRGEVFDRIMEIEVKDVHEKHKERRNPVDLGKESEGGKAEGTR